MSHQIAARSALFALALSLASACATQVGGTRVAARVVSLKSGAMDARGLEPVSGAHLTLQCPAKESREIGTTQADGTLRLDADSDILLDCTVAVAHAGHRPTKVAVAQVCMQQAGSICRNLDVRAVLQPEAGTESAGASH